MDGPTLSAVSVLTGSLVGGLTALGGSWLRQWAQAKAQEEAEDRTAREALYKDFIIEGSRLYGDALEHDEPKMSDLVGLYALISRMRVRSSPNVIRNADTVARNIVDTYLCPNKTFRDLHNMLESGPIDPLRGFSEACREELRPHGSHSRKTLRTSAAPAGAAGSGSTTAGREPVMANAKRSGSRSGAPLRSEVEVSG
jgi:hypothetical protein